MGRSMFDTIYIEESCLNHPRVQSILKRFPQSPILTCQKYGEIFNRKAQNFRMQKQSPSLILAQKHGRFVLPIPPNYSIGGRHNFYFSHMFNCIFDCRYCFLQGHLRSAHYVIFVNFEDFQEALLQKLQEIPSDPVYFFSGYDCDSLALESMTHFVEEFLPFFEKHPRAILEIRTKSVNISSLLQSTPIPNCIIAFSLSPVSIQQSLEHKTPSLSQRLKAIQKLQTAGWKIGLRFDPVIYCDDFTSIYRSFFQEVFAQIQIDRVHSITLGSFRLPKETHKTMQSLYPEEKLFSHSLTEKNGLITYQDNKGNALLQFCRKSIYQHAPKELLFTEE
jgi:spore photoproduct lyase